MGELWVLNPCPNLLVCDCCKVTLFWNLEEFTQGKYDHLLVVQILLFKSGPMIHEIPLAQGMVLSIYGFFYFFLLERQKTTTRNSVFECVQGGVSVSTEELDEAKTALLANMYTLGPKYGSYQLVQKPVLPGISLRQKIFCSVGHTFLDIHSADTCYVLYYLLYISAIMQTAEHHSKILKTQRYYSHEVPWPKQEQ